VTFMRVSLERVEAMLGEVIEEYFDDLTKNRDTPQGKENIVLYFDHMGVRVGIARDYACEIRDRLSTMRELIATARAEGVNNV